MKFKMLALASASLAAAVAPLHAAKPVYGSWGFDVSAMDRSVKPGDDFWEYVNGTWDRRTRSPPTAPPPARSSPSPIGAEKDVRQIVEQLAADPNRDHLGQQVGDFYAQLDGRRRRSSRAAPRR